MNRLVMDPRLDCSGHWVLTNLWLVSTQWLSKESLFRQPFIRLTKTVTDFKQEAGFRVSIGSGMDFSLFTLSQMQNLTLTALKTYLNLISAVEKRLIFTCGKNYLAAKMIYRAILRNFVKPDDFRPFSYPDMRP